MAENDFLTDDELDALNDEYDYSEPDYLPDFKSMEKDEQDEGIAPKSENKDTDEAVTPKSENKDTEELPLSFDDKMTELANKIDELGTQLEDGEISLKQYNKLLSDLTEERAVLRLEHSQQVKNAQKMQSDWESAQRDFFSMPENKSFSEKPILHSALNTAVVELSKRPDLIENKSYPEILQIARDQVEKDLGIRIGNKTNNQSSKRALDRTEFPKTLDGIPASDSQDSGKFAHLDRLSPEELEDALSKLSKQDQDEYLRT